MTDGKNTALKRIFNTRAFNIGGLAFCILGCVAAVGGAAIGASPILLACTAALSAFGCASFGATLKELELKSLPDTKPPAALPAPESH